MALTRADVERTSLLARLHFDEAELASMTEQLGRVVDYFRQLDQVDTTHVEAMAHAVGVENVFADDLNRPSLPRDAVLANAPKHDQEYFRVPAVLGE
jgi:aspartyl-tRNA(Asn)/glutamyl-tRNA(Gln) amidotransferase subunit C